MMCSYETGTISIISSPTLIPFNHNKPSSPDSCSLYLPFFSCITVSQHLSKYIPFAPSCLPLYMLWNPGTQCKAHGSLPLFIMAGYYYLRWRWLFSLSLFHARLSFYVPICTRDLVSGCLWLLHYLLVMDDDVHTWIDGDDQTVSTFHILP